MAKRVVIWGIMAASAVLASNANAEKGSSPTYLNPSLSADVRASDLVHRMTLEEKASQLVNHSRAIPRLGVPAYDWWSEALHGVAVRDTTEFPEPIGLAATFDTAGIEQMAEAAAGRGYEFIAITDHSKGLKIAGGIDEAQLLQQALEIENVNRMLADTSRPVHVLRSVELNLDPRGQGDMDEKSLARLDIVLGCFHSALRKKEDQTQRYLAALRNPAIQILGHPRGRIYNFRKGLTADWSQVCNLAAELDKAVEIDCYPDRQDLNVELLKLAKAAGCRISLGTDSHDPSQLGFIDLGLAAALWSGIQPERILNFMPLNQLSKWIANIR